jgi:signal transduction histidine kinase
VIPQGGSGPVEPRVEELSSDGAVRLEHPAELQIDESTRGLTWRYIFALATIAVLSIVVQLLVQHSVSLAFHDVHVVNRAGLQRMLSQRISKAALLLERDPSGPAREELRRAYEAWSQGHRGLGLGDATLDLPGNNSAEVGQLLALLEPDYQVMAAASRLLLDPTSDLASRQNALSRLLAHEGRFLAQMDAIVERYESESEERTRQLTRGQAGLLGWVLLALLLEGLFVFWPAVRRIRVVLEALAARSQQKAALLAAIPDRVVLFRRDGEISRNLVQPQSEGAPPQSLRQLVPPTLAPIARRAVETTIDTGAVQQFDGGGVGPESQRIELRMARYDTDTAVVLVRDVTEQRLLERRLLDTAAEEQRRIGIELHDGICQQLTGIQLFVQSLETRARRDGEVAAEPLRQLQEFIDQSAQEARRLSHSMYPMVIDVYGLSRGLPQLCAEFSTQTGVRCECQVEIGAHTPPADAPIHLYRITQEALANAVRHARPSRVDVVLVQDADALILTISDDGIGIDPAQSKGEGMGLHTMQHRAQAIGARLEIGARATGGTEVRCILPTLSPAPPAVSA